MYFYSYIWAINGTKVDDSIDLSAKIMEVDGQEFVKVHIFWRYTVPQLFKVKVHMRTTHFPACLQNSTSMDTHTIYNPERGEFACAFCNVWSKFGLVNSYSWVLTC